MTMRGPVRQVVVGALAVVVLAGCPKPGGGGGTGSSSGSSGTSSGGGGVDGGLVSTSCARDQECGGGMVCGGADAGCQAGLACVAGSALCGECDVGGARNCGFPRQVAYCDSSAGVCRRVLGNCEPCSAAEQCGENLTTGYPNNCVNYGATGSYCGSACGSGVGVCGRGFECVGGACQVAAALGGCQGALSCTQDAECPTGQHCTTAGASTPSQGVCLAFCLEDRECPAGKICKTDPGPSYGLCIQGCPPGTITNNLICHEWGRFGTPCPDQACPEGYECSAAATGYCKQQGCDNDTECPLSRTICDVPSRTCVPGCHVAEDCGAFELCQGNTCVPQGCRGKDLSCNIGQFCCGTELYSTDGGQPCPDSTPVGQCFNLTDPFCRVCEDDDGCADITNFGQKSHCYELQRQDADGGTQSLGKFCSVGCRANRDCPRGISCLDLSQEGESLHGCLDARCAGLHP